MRGEGLPDAGKPEIEKKNPGLITEDASRNTKTGGKS